MIKLQSRQVPRSAELNHVASACAESPNASAVTPHCPSPTSRPGASLISLRQFLPSAAFEVKKTTCQLLIGHLLIEANIMLLAYVWFNTRERDAAGMRYISNLTLQTPVRIWRRRQRKGHFWACWMQTRLFVCVHLKFHFIGKAVYKQHDNRRI